MKPFWASDAVVPKQSLGTSPDEYFGGCVMSNPENHNTESWDPALWSIGTVLGAAIFYLACLT